MGTLAGRQAWYFMDFLGVPIPQMGDRWYPAGFGTGGLSTNAITVNKLYAIPFWSSQGGTPDAMQFNVATGGSAGSVARVGVYAAEPTSLMPGLLLFDSGEFDTTQTGVMQSAFLNGFAFSKETLYYFAYLAGTASPTVTTLAGNHPFFGFASGGSPLQAGIKCDFTYGPLPTQYGGANQAWGTSGNVPWIAVRFTS